MCRSFDWDEILSYETPRITVIRDKKLAAFYYLCVFMVITWLAVAVFYQKRYMIFEQPVGSIRLSMQSPQTRNSSFVLEGCEIPCKYWDENLAVYPAIENNAVFLSTRVTNTSKHYNKTTNRYDAIDSSTFHIANVEQFTLLVDHSMYTSFASANGRELNGYSKRGKMDILSIEEILDTINVKLEDLSGADSTHQSTLRHIGCVILIDIEYSNLDMFNPSKITYRYKITLIPDTKFKIDQTIYTKSIDNIVVWNRYGIRIIFQQSGRIGKFDFATLLISFVSGIGLVTVVSFVINWGVIKYFKPCRIQWKNEVYVDAYRASGPHHSKLEFRDSLEDESDIDDILLRGG